MLSHTAHAFLHTLFPTRCVGCDEMLTGAEKVLCGVCKDLITPLPQGCPCCGAPFSSPFALSHSPSHLCGQCRTDPPPFDRVTGGCEYEGPLRMLVHRFKFDDRPDLAEEIAPLVWDTVLPDGADLIVAVPLHPSRLRVRGYNQSLLLAKEIGKTAKIPLLIDTLARIRPTRPQTELSATERAENVKGAFLVRVPDEIAGKGIVLVDDVYTTGSTVRECARVLKEAGAETVTVITAARVVR